MIIKVRVHPRASKNAVVPTPGEYIEVYTTLPPVKNLANKAVLELLAGYFDVPKSQVSLLAGHTSRSKIIEIQK